MPNYMGTGSAITRAIDPNMSAIAVTSAMLALIRKDNVKPFEESRWIVRLPPRDKFGSATYVLTNELRELYEHC